MKLFFICLFFLIITESCKHRHSADSDRGDYSLSGSIKGIDKGWIYIKHRQVNEIDSAKIENGVFTVEGITGTPEFCNIGTGSNGNRDFYFGFFLEPGSIKMHANKDSLYDAAVFFEGSKTQDEFKLFQQQMRWIDSSSQQVERAKQASGKQDTLSQKIKQLDLLRKDMIRRYALQHPNSYITSFEVYSYFTEKEDVPTVDSIFSNMNPKLREWYYTKKIAAYLKEYLMNTD